MLRWGSNEWGVLLLAAPFDLGFAKNVKDNVSPRELKALKAAAEIYLNYNNEKLNQAVKAGMLIEVTSDE